MEKKIIEERMNLPSVAVLISIYKKDNLYYLQQAIDSIQNQEYPKELIHIYLGIDGEIPQNIEEFILQKDCWFKIIRNKTNLGLTRTLNILIDNLGDEKYAFRMDSDDISHKSRFISQVEYLENNSNIAILGTACKEIDSQNNILKVRKYPCSNNEIIKFVARGNPVLHPSMCIRCDIFKNGIRYPKKYRLNQDLALVFLTIMENLELSNLDEPLIDWRVDENFFRRRTINRSISELSIYLKGLWNLYHISRPHIYIFPLFRFFMRLLPPSFVKWIYNSELRNIFLRS